jgi:hypothetical protein
MKFIKTLERPLPETKRAVKLFSQNYDVEKCNSENLLELPGTQEYACSGFPS